MTKPHITPGYNGWTANAPQIIKAIHKKQETAVVAREAIENAKRRKAAELEYYEANNCFPPTTGYFGTETDAHLMEQ